MADKRIVITTAERRRFHFKYHGSGRIDRVKSGTLFEDLSKIGEADSLDDAIQIIKSTLDDDVRDVEVKSW